jgi:outer membrane protein
MRALRTFIIMSVAAVTAICVSATGLLAETLDSALAKAYQDNPQLNAQRALVRATDENVPQALSGYRPKVAVTAAIGEERQFITEQSPLPNGKFVTSLKAAQTFAT